ncbi:3-methyl-2-oxobutanoate hydroxymethyltransferase [Hydrogenovibrio kuenenii]|uniref:3-methyl-2-oxobutanoate hydroxymethyltransferase n=1 Tax=Hydrogenovibrio kuenenii TaxID=63658 RepID=UPI0004BAE269|nr:3-methyl-2-oxobutanoate hydroxymethyltransferase [Hydrogenovibrio kuenenii]
MNTQKRMTLTRLKKMKRDGQKIVCLTAYDAAMAHWVDQAGVNVILVGDTLGMVVQGHETTLPVTLADMVYHTQMVQRGNKSAWCVADMPFMSDGSIDKAMEAAAALMKQARANMVKLEGASKRILSIVEQLSELGVPVCGHIGLLPQLVEKNGYRRAGQDDASARVLEEEAVALEQAGAEMLVLECVPSDTAKRISENLNIPVIGIGSGKESDGQVLVLNDILGTSLGGAPRFAKNFLQDKNSIQEAIEQYAFDVRNGHFPLES